MPHLIKKQIIELTLERGMNHFHIQQQVSDQYWNKILPLLGTAFDAISHGDDLIEIDQLELDLGVVSEKEIEKESWSHEIKMKIQEKIAAITDPASSQYAIRSRDRRLGIFGQWLFYMEHGYLPWNALKPDAHWHQVVLEAIAVDIHSHRTLQDKIRGNFRLLHRIVTQHPERFLQQLTEILTAKKQAGLAESIDELLWLHGYLKKRKIISGYSDDATFKNKRWEWVLGTASGIRHLPAEQTIVTEMIRSFVNEYSISVRIPISLSDKIPLTLTPLLNYSGELKNRQQSAKKKIEGLVQGLQDIKVPKDKGAENNHPEKVDPITRYNHRFLDSEGIFIVNAGAVLLHPFLKSLFIRLNFLNGGEFNSRESQIISMRLIHYLATGLTRATEYELTLAKVLCAFPLEEPLDLPEIYPATYLDECDNLLVAAIAQWSILKNTTAEGLREGFLQRGGKLYSKGGNLYLQVEKNSIDVILDYLPWNLGMIKLPWMKDILRVEWR
jgi:hypothetical protein